MTSRPMTEFDQYLQRGRAQHGDRFNPAGLVPQFRPYFRTGTRIKVRTVYASGYEYIRTGTVGVTTGWMPAFLLMHRRTSVGSSDVLGAKDQIVAVQHARGHYVPV